MQVNLSQQQRELAPEDVPYAYKHIQLKHAHYEQLQRSNNMYYFKFAGAFVFIFLWFLHMQHKGIIPNFQISIAITGIGFLLSFVMLTIMGFENDRNLSSYTSRGKKLEEKYSSLIHSTDFTDFDSRRVQWYRISALFRLFPSIFVFICTAVTGTISSMNVVLWLAVTVACFSAIALLVGLFLYFKIARKLQLQGVNLS